MRKCVWIIILLSVLGFGLGCSKEDKGESTLSVNKNTETTASTEKESTTEPVEEKKEEAKDLMGLELINSLEVKMPEALFIEAVNKSEGMTIHQKMYIHGEDFRVESKGDFANQVMVYNSKEGITYIYDDTMPTGTMIRDLEDAQEEEKEEVNLTYGAELFEDIGANLIEAKKMTYNGYDVIYLVVKDSESGDGFEIRQWISTEFWYPVKVETVLNGAIISEYELVNISSKEALDSKWYEKPSGIEFIDLDAMMNITTP